MADFVIGHTVRTSDGDWKRNVRFANAKAYYEAKGWFSDVPTDWAIRTFKSVVGDVDALYIDAEHTRLYCDWHYLCMAAWAARDIAKPEGPLFT